MSQKKLSLAQISDSYNALAGQLGKTNLGPLDINLDEVNKKLLQAVSNELTGITSEIKSLAAEGFKHSSEVVVDVKTLPETLSKDISTLPNTLGIASFNYIASCVRELLNSFQEVVQNPSVIFPRLPCGDVPVDPALISSFKNRYLNLQHLNQNDPELKNGERSMPTAPKTALDVITNVTSSLESFADDVLASTEALANVSGELEKLRDLVQGLRPAAEPVIEMFEKQEAIHDMVSRILLLFDTAEETTPSAARSPDEKQFSNPLDLFKEASLMVEKMNGTSDELQGTVTKMQGASTIFSSSIQDMKAFFSVLVQSLSRLADSLQKLKANLPRIARELRQFFMPTGFKAFFFRPSNTLVTILESLEDIKTGLSKPEAVARAAIDTVKEGDSAGKVEAVKTRFDNLEAVPNKLVSAIQTQDIPTIITDTLEKVVSELMNEIGANAIQGAASSVLEAVGAGGLAGRVRSGLGSLLGQTADKKQTTLENDHSGSGKVSLPWAAEKLFR